MSVSSRAKLGIFGGLNVRTGQWDFTLSARKRSADFIAFLIVLLTRYATGVIYVIVDNASIHHSAATLKWLLTHPLNHPILASPLAVSHPLDGIRVLEDGSFYQIW